MNGTGRAATLLKLLAIWGIATIINITKAVHMDDTYYLEIARAILANPLHPMSGSINWVNTSEPIYHTAAMPLLWPYLLAIVMKVCGESELAFHLLMAVFTLGSIGFFYALAQRFAPRNAMLLTSIFALGPAFIPSQNLMLDVPMMAFWLMFFWALFCGGKDEHLARRYALAGLAVAAACLMKYTSLVLLPIFVLHLALERRWRYGWALGIPVVALALWSAFNVFDYGQVHLLQKQGGSAHFSGIPFAELPRRLLDCLTCIGAVSPFAIVCLPYLKAHRQGRILLGAGAACFVLSLGWTFIFWGEDIVTSLLRAAFLSGAVVLLGAVLPLPASVSDSRDEKKDFIILAAWPLLTFAFVIPLAPFLAIRHVLPAIPALLLLLGAAVLPAVSRRTLQLGFAVTALSGVILGISDWQYANAYRVQAPVLRQQLPTTATVWFMGHWGWQWYAAKSGMQQYDLQRSHLSEGDYIVVPHMVGIIPIAAQYAPLMKEGATFTVPAIGAGLFHTMSQAPPGGYYAGGVQALPWRFSGEPLEQFTIYQIKTP